MPVQKYKVKTQSGSRPSVRRGSKRVSRKQNRKSKRVSRKNRRYIRSSRVLVGGARSGGAKSNSKSKSKSKSPNTSKYPRRPPPGLPLDVLRYVQKNLSLQDKAAFAMVNKQGNRATQSDIKQAKLDKQLRDQYKEEKSQYNSPNNPHYRRDQPSFQDYEEWVKYELKQLEHLKHLSH